MPLMPKHHDCIHRAVIVAIMLLFSHAVAMQQPSQQQTNDNQPPTKRQKSSPPATQTEGSQTTSAPLSLGESQPDTMEVKEAKPRTNQARRKTLYDTLDPMPLELINMIIAYTETTIAAYNEHSAAIKAMAFLNGGKYLATASLDGTIRILNLQSIYEGQSPRCECIIPSHTLYSNCLATVQTQDGELLANNIPDTCISIFNPDNKGECISTIQTKEHPHEVEITPWQPTGSQIDDGPRRSTITSLVPWERGTLLVGFADDALETWALNDLKNPSFFNTVAVKQPKNKNYRGGFDHIVKLDKTHFATRQNNILRIWQLTNIKGIPVRTCKIEDKDQNQDITCIAPLPNHQLVCGCSHGAVCLYDWQTGKRLRKTQPTDEAITAITTQHEQHIVFGTQSGAIRIWNPERASFATIQQFFAHPVTALLVTPKEGWIIAGFGNGSIMLFV